MRRLILAGLAATALVLGANPASANHVATKAQDERACAHEDNSPSCNHAGEPGGIEANHNESLVLDA